jgi:hypothetical protein
MTVEQWASWAVGIMGAVCFVAGIMAYQGRYTSWLVLKSFLFPGWVGLASLYLGVALMMFGLARFLLAVEAPGFVMTLWLLVTGPSVVIGMVGFF